MVQDVDLSKAFRESKQKLVVLIMAAGTGERAGGEVPKQYQHFRGKSLLRLCVETFISRDDVEEVQVVIHPEHEDHYNKAVENLRLLPPVHGGETRQKSVYLGLQALGYETPDVVLVHDAARPFASHAIIDRVLGRLMTHEAVIPAIPVTDTLKRKVSGRIVETLNREQFCLAQTPQGFRYKQLLRLHERYAGQPVTDDAALFELAGEDVAMVAGEATNGKITTAEDVEALLKEVN